MKISEISNLRVSQKAIDDIDINPTDVIVTDEFYNKSIESEPCYRKRAIKRLAKNKLSITNNNNITFDLVKEFISIKCPYCKNQMKYTSGGGNSSTNHMEYKCDCGASSNLELNHNSGIVFYPKSS